MAIGKNRSRRSSSSSSSGSYKSTITTLVFVVLCVVGLWVLTSSSIVSPQTTTSTRTTNGFVSNTPVKPIRHHPKKDSHVFDDTPGDLPNEAIKDDSTTTSTTTSEDSNRSDVLKQPVEEVDKSNLLERSKDPETTATAEQENEQHEHENGEGNRHEQEQEEHDSQVTEESNLTNTETEETDQHQSHKKNPHETETQNTEDHSDQAQHETEVESSENPQQNQQGEQQNHEDTEVDSHKQEIQQETQTQIQENAEQIQQDKQVESSENPPETEVESISKQDTEIDSQEHLQQSHQDNINNPTEQQEAGDGQSYQPTQDISNQESQQEAKLNESNSAKYALDGAAQSGIPKESNELKAAWSTQAHQSENQKERKTDQGSMNEYTNTWVLCNVTAGADYIPCLDNEEALKRIHNTGHYEHRERHCPDEGPSCLVPVPDGYKRSIEWPTSRDKIWYHNIPHTKLAEVKGHQNWVKVTGEFLTFPGGGTQFIHGALHYIDFLQKALPKIAWGKHTRVVLDVGCGVASFGGFLFDRDVLALSFAPKDEHEAQVQFALERGIPAISAVMGTQRLPFPGSVFDLVHCARCRVPWHKEGGTLLLELNRVLRPGGYFVWSATPVYQKLPEDVEIWKAMSSLTASLCWELVTIQKDKLNSVGAAIYRKPTSNECYNQRKHKRPPMCKSDDDPNAAWYVPLQSCMHNVPVDMAERGSQWPEMWPTRVHQPPYWLSNTQKGIYGKPAPEDFIADYEHWRQVVTKTYMSGLQISWSNVRNVMDMRAVYGGFAAALKDLKVWVMNVVSVNGPDTLPIIYERGLFGIYHDWVSTGTLWEDLVLFEAAMNRLKSSNTDSVFFPRERIYTAKEQRLKGFLKKQLDLGI
ncbi:hypothetical protein IFM89_037642 [Coptis chinensis]|uniref:Methyltransferase PMT27 n=1 Tax=Coptis chinensis TaxID=261450 RepID=A0A835MGR0_9MAGN|nr:hypothetical protein IFM89_037642 [Coptis chinensis]